MPVGYNHYYYKDFREDLNEVSPADAAVLRSLEVQERELRNQANAVRAERMHKAHEMLRQHYAAVKPMLRPCHQARFDRTGIDKAIEPELEGFI